MDHCMKYSKVGSINRERLILSECDNKFIIKLHGANRVSLLKKSVNFFCI